jgi:ABC-2 type transport system permease protein
MKTLSLVKKELKHYFYSPLAYVVICIFLLITGWFFSNSLFLVREVELRGMLDIMPLILMFFMPAVTMRLVAEEKKVDTIQLILTMPVNEWQIILSKYLSAVVFLFVSLVFTLIYPLILYLLGRPDGGVIIAGYISLLLLGASYISIGLFASTITSSQVVAFIVGFSIIFIFFILDRLELIFPLHLQPIIEKLSVVTHFENMARGVINSGNLIYFLTLNILFLVLSTYILQRRKR